MDLAKPPDRDEPNPRCCVVSTCGRQCEAAATWDVFDREDEEDGYTFVCDAHLDVVKCAGDVVRRVQTKQTKRKKKARVRG